MVSRRFIPIEHAQNALGALQSENSGNTRLILFYSVMRDVIECLETLMKDIEPYPDKKDVMELASVLSRATYCFGDRSRAEEKILNSDELTAEEKVKVIKVLKK